MKMLQKLEVDIVLIARTAPDRSISPAKLVRTLESIIQQAVQVRMPEFEVEIRSLKADWPGAPDNFPEYDLEKQK